jgi:kynureninase
MDELLRWRAEFPILEQTVHLINHSLGAMPRRTRDRLNEFADTWQTRGIRAWEEGWWDMPVRVGDLIGRIIGAGPGETVMHQNVSVANALVLSCFDWTARRNKLVTDSLNFPSNLYQFHEHAGQGMRVVKVQSPDGIHVPLERLLEEIDEETALVSISHVIFRSAFVQDVAAIVEKAHAVGAMVCADVYQSAGVMPVDVRAWDVDFATGGSVKWLCGGPGAGFLYVRPDLWPSLRPKATGWMAHREPFAFSGEPIEYAEDAFRFLNGTPGIPALYSAMSGYEIILEAGVERIRAKSVKQTEQLIQLAEEAGFRVVSPKIPAERGGSIILDVPHGYEVTRELARRNFLVDFRPGAGIRVGPHFYNTNEELQLLVREIRTVLEAVAATA